jgi:hypothetical protein
LLLGTARSCSLLPFPSQTAALLDDEPFLLGLINWRVLVAVVFEAFAILLVLRLWLRSRG